VIPRGIPPFGRAGGPSRKPQPAPKISFYPAKIRKKKKEKEERKREEEAAKPVHMSIWRYILILAV
jgi:hypothetical protein